jgi:catechol 2,3-dioxygenase-like lactoylglutathione lyase family enzyme
MMGRVSDEDAPDITGVSHIDLSVADRERSARWYCSVLGFDLRERRFNEDAGLPWILLVHPAGASLALVQHPDNCGESFDERRCGLDHLSFTVATRADLEAFRHRLAQAGVVAPPIVDTDTASVIVLRDPDNIQIELCAWRAATIS